VVVRPRSVVALAAVAAVAAGALASRTDAQRAAKATANVPAYEVFAIRYASLPFRISDLVVGADTGRRLDIAMMVWLIRQPGGRVVLVDAGFYRDKFMTQWKPAQYIRTDSAIARLGLKPADVTDLIVTHIHWDHFDGADLFPGARYWIQRDEVEHHIDSAGRVLDRTIDRLDAAMLQELRSAGRVQLVDGDAREILPGITVYTGGKHTFQSQYVSVKTAEGTVVLASDNVYMYENFEKHVPIAQTLDRVANVAAQDRMLKIATNPRLIVPGHDPAVFTKFGEVSPGIVRIR
jgi:glyoxylase-like metal-dependent hydrolase (beta-lactamase superfamily II)